METTTLPKDAILVVNAHSRRGQDNFDQAREKLEAAGVRLIAAHAVKDPEQMAATVRVSSCSSPMASMAIEVRSRVAHSRCGGMP